MDTGNQPVIMIVKGKHNAGSEKIYEKYIEGTKLLLRKYPLELVAFGSGCEREYTTETWPINIIFKFRDEQTADGFFRDPDYVFIKENYRDKAYEEMHMSLFKLQILNEVNNDTILVVMQATQKQGEETNYEEKLSHIEILLSEYGVDVMASGLGDEREYINETWQLNTVLKFPNLEVADRFMRDPRYYKIMQNYRDKAYFVYHVTMFQTKPIEVSPKASLD